MERKILPVSTATVRAMQYMPASDEMTMRESYCVVDSPGTFELSKPRRGGVFDAHLGVTSSAYKCATCGLDKEKCHGHSGDINLGIRVCNPVMIQEIIKWLKVICFNCGNPLANAAEIAAMRGMSPIKRFDYLSKRVSGKTHRVCAACGAQHPAVTRPDRAKYSFIARSIGADGASIDTPLYGHNIGEVFDKITPATVEFFGRRAIAHPRAFILSRMYVPSVNIRPDSKKQAGRGSAHNSITSGLKDIITFVTRSLKQQPAEIAAKIATNIGTLEELIAQMLIGGTERSKSIAMLLKGKHGRLRENILGKRAAGMGRSTIDGSPRLHPGEITIPLFVAQTLTIRETVNSFNRERLMLFVANGERRYPGCSRIEKRDGSVFKPNSPNLRIEDGDAIIRDLITGDRIGFNRQPTLTQSSITSMRVVVDTTALAIDMNPLVCVLFGADFDGDQMNLINYSREESLNEQRMLTDVESHMTSFATGGILVGQAGDSIVGLAKLTQSGMQLNKRHACQLFSTTQYMPNFSDLAPTDHISGRALATITHPPLNYSTSSAYYKRDAPWMRWMAPSPDDERVNIVGGKLLSGCIDKATLGAGHNSIYQAMVHEFGPARALECIFNDQQIGINFLSQLGFTTGIRDFLIAPSERAKVDAVSQDIEARSKRIVEQLDRGEIIPSIGMTREQFYEEQQIAAQRITDEYHELVIRGIKDPRKNGAFEMMATGCKGQITFMVNMVAAVGLVLINRQRVPLNYGYQRTLPYFQRYDESPRARGFIERSFMSGLSLAGCLFNAMMARIDIITRAMMTSVTGDQNRKSVKALESVIIDNYRMAVKDHDIVSFVYGCDYFDPRKLEAANYTPAIISDAEFESKFHYKSSSSSSSSARATFDEEFSTIREDRARFRRAYKTLEELSIADKVSPKIRLPFNIPHLIERLVLALARADSTTGSAKHKQPASAAAAAAAFDPDEMMRDPVALINTADRAQTLSDDPEAALLASAAIVAQFCRDAPYLFVNEVQRARRGWVPEFTVAAAANICAYVRAELCSVALARLREKHAIARDPIFVVAILRVVATTIIQSMIDPGKAVGIIAAQSFSEPFTQNMLDSYKLTALGISGRSKMGKCQEIMSAYTVDKLANPIMTISLTPEFSASKERAQEIAQSIEMLRFSQLVSSWGIFCERFGQPVHPEYVHERETIAQFIADNPLLPPPADQLANLCIRFELNKSALVLKNISMQEIITKLRSKYNDLYLVYTTERAPRVIIRVYIRAVGLERFSVATSETEKRHKTTTRRGREEHILNVYRTIIATTIRGVDGVKTAIVRPLIRTRTDESGAIVNDAARFCVITNGTNIARVAGIPGVVPEMIQTDAIQEIAEYLGIEAARHRITTEMYGLVDSCDVRHYMIYADEMTRTGRVTSIERSGLGVREANNVALRAGQASPVQVLTDAAIHARRDVLSGMSGQLICGSIPRIGTLYNAVVIDPEVIKKYKQTATAALADI